MTGVPRSSKPRDVIAAPLAPRTRLGWVDYAKGISIICVVFGHVVGGLEAAELLPVTGPHAFATRVMYAFRMPALFFLSGLFLYRSVQKKAVTFLIDRASVLMYPCMLWSIIHAGTRRMFSHEVNAGPQLRATLWALAYRPFGELWFLYVLFLICLLLLVLNRLRVRPFGVVGISIGLYLLFFRINPDSMGVGPLACKYSLYAALGYFCSASRSLDLFTLPTRRYPLIFVPAFGALIALSVPLHFKSLFSGPLLALFGVSGVISLAKWLEAVNVLSIVRMIGSRSLQIYLAHLIATGGLRIFMQRVMHLRNATFMIGVLWAAGLLLPLGLDWLVRRTGAYWVFSLRRDVAGRSAAKSPVSTPTPSVTSRSAIAVFAA